jgi:glycosyltransferase involved in cell wall biosynthesis
MAGYRLAVATNAFVYHLGSATFKGNSIPHAELMERNSRKFYKKVGEFSTSSFHFPASAPETIKVSVILRTMNRSGTLQHALMSLANQTYRDFEVVIVNDGGEDIADQLSAFQGHLAIQYVRHEVNKGRSAAANAGLDHSQGQWITFLDDDDIVYPWHLESLTQAIAMSGHQFVYGNFNQAIYLSPETMEADILRTPASWDFCMDDFLVINYIPIHCWLFSRACLDEVGKMDENLDRLEDYDFLLRFSARYPFYHLSRVTCEYRFNQPNQNSAFVDINRTLAALETIYKRYPVDDPRLFLRRVHMIGKIQGQIRKVKDIADKTGITLSAQDANREIIRTILEA